jgi:hypothetical protein
MWRKIRKTIINLKYNQENQQLLEAQIKTFDIENYLFLQFGK